MGTSRGASNRDWKSNRSCQKSSSAVTYEFPSRYRVLILLLRIVICLINLFLIFCYFDFGLSKPLMFILCELYGSTLTRMTPDRYYK